MGDDLPNILDQASIDALLSQVEAGGGLPDVSPAPTAGATGTMMMPQQASVGGSGGIPPPSPFPLEQFDAGEELPDASKIDLLKDVILDVKIELGRTSMYIEDILRLTEGSVVELDKLAGDPVDILVNGRIVARGEILILNDNFAVRIAEILNTREE